MTGESNRCPDPEVLAAFVAGNLSGAELKMTADHLRTCEDCRTILADTAYVARQENAPVVAKRPSWSPRWLAAAAAVLIGVFCLSYWYTTARHGNAGVRTLVAAAPRDGRYVEPRMSGGFPWAPLRPAHRTSSEPLDAGQMKLVGAAGDVLERTAGDRSIEAQHAAALAHLVAGRPREAAALLVPIAANASDARIWTDLAAARFAVATQNDDSPQLARALAACDAALNLDPKLPEALFDRALILERLGLREQAIVAWQQYLSVDTTTSWATEARQHLRVLGTQSSFRQELERDYARLAADPAMARALATRYPQEARLWGETEILGRWADAWQSRDVAAANQHLQLAHSFGDDIAARSGERMLQSAVATIEAAGEPRKSVLATAHVDFRRAQKTYQAGRPADAERMFATAATHFEEGGSPLALAARYFGANTAFDQGRIAEARARLEVLVAGAPPELPAHRAQTEWELGLTNASLGRWGEAMRVLRDSVATFERIGEMRNATAVREILAEVYDQIGEPAAAWHHRIIALREIGRTQNPRLRVVVESIARAAILDRDWPVALSFLSVELEVVDRGDTMALVETLLLRARVQGRMGHSREAGHDLARATAAILSLGDPAMREHAEADRVAVAACLAPPSDAVAFLTRAIEFHRVKGRRIFLPEMLFERGRALEAVGSRSAAAEDYDRAIAELEAQRTSIDPGNERWGVFTAAGELFDNAVALAVSRGDTRAAFAYAEHSRARDVLDRVDGVAPSPPSQAISGDTVVVEYASLPASLVIFVAYRGRVRIVQQDVARGTLTAWAQRLADSAAADDRDEFQRIAAALYSRLVAPVGDSVDAAHMVVFVPDITLSTIPFSALVDPHGRYLVEQHPVVVAPSAAVYARLASHTRHASSSPRALIIVGPPAREGDLRDLSAARREAEAVAAAYRNSVTLGPNDDERDALAGRTAGVDVIHFVGHAVEPDGSADAALVTSPTANDVLNVRDIASMHLADVGVVVLAACSTARGPGSRGISIAHAFVAAGVPSVVATLWPIADGPAAEFFPRLHRRLAKRLPAAEALRATQLECIHRRDAPPGLWAAVEIIGS